MITSNRQKSRPEGRLSASCGFLPLSPLTRCTRMCICTSSCRPYYPRDSQLAQRLQVNQARGKQALRLFRDCRRWRAARLDHLQHQDALSKGHILRMKQSRRSCVCNFASKTLQWCRSCLRRGLMRGRLLVRTPLIATTLQGSGNHASACARNEQASHANRECLIARLR